MPEHLLIGWEQIHKMLCDQDGNAIISLSTLKKKHGDDMKKLGVVLKMNFGRSKRPIICAWPSRIMWYFTYRQVEKEKD